MAAHPELVSGSH